MYAYTDVLLAIEKDITSEGVFGIVTALFIPLWKLSFLHMC
jgi:hypothetical protein